MGNLKLINNEDRVNIASCNQDGVDVTSEMGLPMGWKVNKSRKGYDIICPDGDKFDGGIGALAEYLGIEIRYNGRVHYGKGNFKLINNENEVNIASELGIPEGWKVTKLETGFDITRPDGDKFDGGLGALAEYLGIEITYNGRVHYGTNKFKRICCNQDGVDVTSELGLPEGWKVTKMGAKYAITCPNGDDFDGGLDDLAEYLGIKICYNGRWNYGKGKNRVKKKDSLDITSELRLPVGWKVTKSGSDPYDITRP